MSDKTKPAKETIWTAAASSPGVLAKLDMTARPPAAAAARARVAEVQANLDKDLQAYSSKVSTETLRKRVK